MRWEMKRAQPGDDFWRGRFGRRQPGFAVLESEPVAG